MFVKGDYEDMSRIDAFRSRLHEERESREVRRKLADDDFELV